MSTINDTDQFLVQRGTTSHKQSAKDLMSTIQDTDLMLVQRGEESYKVTCLDVKDQLGGGGGGSLGTVTLAPLSVTLDSGVPSDITAVTNLSEILPGSDITFKWYQYEAATGGTGTLLQTTVSDTAIQDTYTVKGADQGKYIGCTASYLGTTVTETARSQINVAAVPVADMNGLRFDSNRDTNLSKDIAFSQTLTASFWAKLTATNNNFIFCDGNDYQTSAFRIFTNDKFQVILGDSNESGGSTAVCEAPLVIEKNVWKHYVVQIDLSDSSERVKIWINGDKQTVTNPPNYTGSGLFKSNTKRIGKNGSNIAGNPTDASKRFNGYLSDVYFVDGLALEPTAFGKEFVLGWGPLDSSEVEENLGNAVVQPFDTRPNMDQEWSANELAGSQYYPGEDAVRAFDGDFATWAAPPISNAGAYWGVTLNRSFTKLEIAISDDSGVKANKILVNDVDITSGLPLVGAALDYSWVDITDLVSGNTINTYKITNEGGATNFRTFGIRIDGRILVDGPANNDQVWSSGTVTSVANNGRFSTIANLFDGDTSTSSLPLGDGNNSDVTIAFPQPISDATLVEIYSGTDAFNGRGAYINSESKVNFNTNGWNTIYNGAATTLTSIGFNTGGQNDMAAQAVRVNGLILVDGAALGVAGLLGHLFLLVVVDEVCMLWAHHLVVVVAVFRHVSTLF